jgi:hypothetical protein
MDQGQFYFTKVLMEWKNKEGGNTHQAVVQQFKDFCVNLQAYVKEYHLTGLFYNPHGKEFQV